MTWDTHAQLVLGKLEEHTRLLEKIAENMIVLKTDLAVIKWKVMMIGAFAGGIVAFAMKHLMGAGG